MWSNWFDICVIVLVLVTLVMYMHSVHRTKHSQATVEEDIGLAVLIVRNLAMILRICIMVKKYVGSGLFSQKSQRSCISAAAFRMCLCYPPVELLLRLTALNMQYTFLVRSTIASAL
jgi:hypothetical protein